MRTIALGTVLLIFFAAGALPSETTRPWPGLRENTPAVHAFTGATVVTGPGTMLENATLVIRDGVILAVGTSVKPPSEARIWDSKGRYIYPGLIDLYSHYGQSVQSEGPNEARDESQKGGEAAHGAVYWSDKIRPEKNGALEFSPDTALAATLRSQGITLVLSVPDGGILSGTGALVTTGAGFATDLLIREEAALGVQFNTSGWDSPDYPGSLMGVLAQFRQSYLDADWHRRAQAAWAEEPTFERPQQITTLSALSRLRDSRVPLLFDVKDENMLLRAASLAREIGLPAIMRGSNYEYRRLTSVVATGFPVILPVDFPKPPAVKTQEEALGVTLGELRHWYLAPACAGRLAKAGVRIALTASGLKDGGEFLKAVRTCIERGLSEKDAMAALTSNPAHMLGLEERYGSIAPGKAASFVIANGELFGKETEVLETWVEGTRYVISPQPRLDLRGTWSFTQGAPARLPDTLSLSFSGKPAELTGKLGLAPEVKLDQLEILGTQLSFSFSGDSVGLPGITRVSATVDSISMLGTGTWPDGVVFDWSSSKFPDSVHKALHENPKGEGKEGAEGEKAGEPKPDSPLVLSDRFPDGEFGFTSPPPKAGLSAFTHATIWTCGPQGTLRDATLLVADGKIVGAGSKLTIPGGAHVVDATGAHITPGLIDCHSHTAISGDVNEGTQTISAEVRIGDVIDPDDIGVYWELAGGLTVANLLHGSANAIGGQNQVVKLRWGSTAEEMKFVGAPPGIKFALGENPKQSNWGDRFTSRYPQTRMGVEQIIRDALVAAQEYRARREAYKKRPEGMPPRQDLEMDALVEVLEGRRLVHSHSYRQDEILMLMRLAEEFGFRVATFQHVLEGYKVADRMKEHGAGASTFSDWWAYKFEVYDAIPYNGALMHEAGVVVSFNSDSGELARRLYTEAAKAVKYGGVSPEEALRFVTRNPAIQLGIDQRVGTLEPGKDADFAIWSGDPLSTYTLCQQTWIDGRLYFDRVHDRTMQDEMQKEKAVLVQKALESKDEGGEEKDSQGDHKPGYSCCQEVGGDDE